jgi:integration host factor subunit alpha
VAISIHQIKRNRSDLKIGLGQNRGYLDPGLNHIHPFLSRADAVTAQNHTQGKRTGFLLGGIMALTKSDIVATVHELGFTKKKSVDIIETLLEIIKGSLQKNEDVLISGFGKFCVKDKNQRRGRNPATGDDLILRERRVVTFKCSGKLRKKINGHL